MRPATIVCVLGMSRSGTSLTARTLNLAGVHLGSDSEMLQPLPANPEGFWEHFRIMRLNEGILESLGGSWRDPPPMPAGWEWSPQLDATRETALELVEESFAGRGLWGWKDPRTSLTLPFWQRLLSPMRYVICLRNPTDVAASLERRDGISSRGALELWRRYLASAIVNTAGRPRLFVSYEEYFDDWRAPAERLVRFVNDDSAALDSAFASSVEAAVDRSLWHHRSTVREAILDPDMPDDVAVLYLLAEQLRALGSSHAPRGDAAPPGQAALEAAVDAYARRGLVQRSSK